MSVEVLPLTKDRMRYLLNRYHKKRNGKETNTRILSLRRPRRLLQDRLEEDTSF